MVKSIENAEQYTWGVNCSGWHLLKTDTLSVIQEKMPPGASERLHFHAQAQQLFYILSGVASFEVEGRVVVVKANESIHIPSGTKHCLANKGDTALAFIVVSEPKSHGDRHDL
jgi:mannose-6-phosphate isomerase-like protein (cupin superfamily)